MSDVLIQEQSQRVFVQLLLFCQDSTYSVLELGCYHTKTLHSIDVSADDLHAQALKRIYFCRSIFVVLDSALLLSALFPGLILFLELVFVLVERDHVPWSIKSSYNVPWGLEVLVLTRLMVMMMMLIVLMVLMVLMTVSTDDLSYRCDDDGVDGIDGADDASDGWRYPNNDRVLIEDTMKFRRQEASLFPGGVRQKHQGRRRSALVQTAQRPSTICFFSTDSGSDSRHPQVHHRW